MSSSRGINGYTEKVFNKIMPFTGRVVKGKQVEGDRGLDTEALVYLLGDMERRLVEIESRLEIKD